MRCAAHRALSCEIGVVSSRPECCSGDKDDDDDDDDDGDDDGGFNAHAELSSSATMRASAPSTTACRYTHCVRRGNRIKMARINTDGGGGCQLTARRSNGRPASALHNAAMHVWIATSSARHVAADMSIGGAEGEPAALGEVGAAEEEAAEEEEDGCSEPELALRPAHAAAR